MRIVAPIPQKGGLSILKKRFFFVKRKKSSKTEKLKNFQKYAKISNTPFDQRSLICREVWVPGGSRIPKNPNCLKNGKFHLRRKNSKVQKYAKNSDTPFDQRFLIHRKAWFPLVLQAKSAKTKIGAILDQSVANI